MDNQDVSQAAAALGRKRWAGVSARAKSRHAKMMARARHAALTPEERSELARRAIETRWARARQRKLAEEKAKRT